MIEAHVDVKTADGYIIRVFTIAFTKRIAKDAKKTAYAKSSQVKAIRRKITTILSKEISTVNVNDLVKHLTQDTYTEKMIKACQFIYPLSSATIRKVKVLKRPKIDAIKLNEMYSHETKRGGVGASKIDEEDEAANTLKKAQKSTKTEKPAKKEE